MVQFIKEQGKSANCFSTNKELGKHLSQLVDDPAKEKLLVVFSPMVPLMGSFMNLPGHYQVRFTP